jgi:MFS family permease
LPTFLPCPRRGRLPDSRPVVPSFTDPRFALLLTGEAVNSIGSWASAIALWGFAAYRFNASPGAVSVTIVCWAAPSAVLSPLLGVYVDRLGPKRALVAGYLAAAGAALGLALAAGSLAALDTLAVAYGITRALTGPAAGALPPRIVSPGDLLAANSLLGGAATAGQVAGPVAASAALALSGFRAAFVVDAVTYLIGAVVVAPLPLRREPGGDPAGAGRRSWRQELAEGFTTVTRDRRLRLVARVSAGVALTSGAFLVVEPLYARHVLHRPASQFALFEAAAGAGGILASLALPRLRDRLGGRALAASAVGYGLAACVFTGTAWIPVAYAGAFAWGIAGAVFGTVAVTSLQREAPVHAHGRVMGVAATVQSAADTVGLPLAGATLAALGVRAGAVALAAVAVAAGVSAALTPLPPAPVPAPPPAPPAEPPRP